MRQANLITHTEGSLFPCLLDGFHFIFSQGTIYSVQYLEIFVESYCLILASLKEKKKKRPCFGLLESSWEDIKSFPREAGLNTVGNSGLADNAVRIHIAKGISFSLAFWSSVS